MITAKLLRECGYTILEAGDAKTALDVWSKFYERIDLVMSDIVMPGMNGLEMVEQMRQSPAGRPKHILLVSAYSDKKPSDHDLSQEGNHFIEKPYTANDLLRALREILKQ